MVKFTKAVDVARESFAHAGEQSEFDFSEDFFQDVLDIAWKHKSDSEPRKDVKRALLDLIRAEASRREETGGN